MPLWPEQRVPPLVTMHPMSLESMGQQLKAVAVSIQSNATGTWPTANLALFVPFQLYVPATFVQMAVLMGGTNGDNIDVGIFDSQGNRIVSSGSTAQGSTNVVQTFDITDTTLAPGTYFLACACSGTTGAVSRYAPTGTGFCAGAGMLQTASAFALPASVTFASVAQEYVPFIVASTRTVL